jgi:hypothetical protein
MDEVEVLEGLSKEKKRPQYQKHEATDTGAKVSSMTMAKLNLQSPPPMSLMGEGYGEMIPLLEVN